jgi:hypothetical protein
MKAAQFETTAEFKNFKAVMRHVLAMPKAELDALVSMQKEESPRKGDPDAPGRKRTKRRSSMRAFSQKKQH